MKTIGEILKAAREDKMVSLERLSALTKIDQKYLEAIESDQYTKLPSATVAKGFIRNIAKILDKNPDDMVAVFRRDYNEKPLGQAPVLIKKSNLNLTDLFHYQATYLVFGFLIFIFYLIFQYRAVISSPKLEVTNPQKNAVLVSPVVVDGNTMPGNTVIINGDLKVIPDSQGHFSAKIDFSAGNNQLEITATSTFGRKTTLVLPITILNQ